jgi:hypothetical protein
LIVVSANTGLLFMRKYAKKGQYVRVGYVKLSEEKDSSRTLEQAY